jgi:hypothetical protein
MTPPYQDLHLLLGLFPRARAWAVQRKAESANVSAGNPPTTRQEKGEPFDEVGDRGITHGIKDSAGLDLYGADNSDGNIISINGIPVE